MNTNEYGVLLAVGADGVRDGVLDLAASEAIGRGTGVELLHVVHSLVVASSEVDEVEPVDRVMSKVGREVLTDAATRMRHRLGVKLPVSTQLLYGRVASTISARAAGAEVVVLERRDAGSVERMLTMAVSSRVAAHAAAPVVVVPRTWSSTAADDRPLTVGVDHAPDALGQVEAAADYACVTHRPLVALHAVWLAKPYQDMTFMDYERRHQWVTDATAELERSLGKLADRDGLDLRYDVRWARPTETLVEATRTSSLLILSRRAPGHRGGHLGPITRAVLQHADGPVMLVDRT